MRLPGKKWWTGGGFLLIAAAFVGPEMRFRRALPKYSLGISAEALQSEYGIHVALRKNGNYLTDDASDLEKRRHLSYDAYVPADFVRLAPQQA